MQDFDFCPNLIKFYQIFIHSFISFYFRKLNKQTNNAEKPTATKAPNMGTGNTP